MRAFGFTAGHTKIRSTHGGNAVKGPPLDDERPPTVDKVRASQQAVHAGGMQRVAHCLGPDWNAAQALTAAHARMAVISTGIVGKQILQVLLGDRPRT